MFKDFDHYNFPVGADGTAWSYLERLRDYSVETEQQIGWSEQHGGFWVCVGYDAAKQIYTNTEAFSSRETTLPLYASPGNRPLMWVAMDEPLHSRYRSLVQAQFTPGGVSRIAERLRVMTNNLIDGFIQREAVDVVPSFTDEIPGRTAAILVDIPQEDGEFYRRWVSAVIGGDDPDAVARMETLFYTTLEHRKEHLGDDLLSLLIRAHVEEGRPLTDLELYDSWVMLVLGGIDNPRYVLNMSLWRLAWDPELRRRLIAQPEKMHLAVDELMRYYTPAMTVRVVDTPVTVAGVEMQSGQKVLTVLPVCNRDPRQFEYPDVLNIDRSPNRHLAVGMGIHRCLGAHLSKLQLTIAIEEFLRRIPDFSLDPDGGTAWHSGQTMGFEALPLILHNRRHGAAITAA